MKLKYVISIVSPGMAVVFKKIFDRKEMPINEGSKNSVSKLNQVNWVKKYFLELNNMEGTPSYVLTHQLTIGSEIGNIIIADPTVSPRHCTFVLQEDVISVLDHGSRLGTHINGVKITPGRYIILEETDVIKVGDLEVKIRIENEVVHVKKDHEEVKTSIHPSEVKNNDMDPPPFEVSKPLEDEQEFEAEVKESKKNSGINGNKLATNSLIRLVAVICDILVAYIIYTLFNPFDEFRAFVTDVPTILGSFFDIDGTGLWTALTEEYPFIEEMGRDIYSFFSSTFKIGPFILMFALVRFTSTLLLGVSLSEAVLGVRSHGNALWKRIGGGLRVLIGLLTGPFLIFDAPSVISRRTFKEFMTFTHTYLHSRISTILGTLLYLPLLLGLSILSPLFQGLELPEPIAINEKLDTRVRVTENTPDNTVTKKLDHSAFLHLELTYDPQQISLIPTFKFSGQQKKINYRPSLVVYNKELQRAAQVEVFKTFDFKGLLSIGHKGDFFLQEKFPEIHDFIYSPELANPAFKKANTDESNKKFAVEMIYFIKSAFELSASNAFEYMHLYTPFLKGMIDFRSTLLELLEYKEFDQIDFLKLGNAYFMRISYSRQKPFDLIIPLIREEGRILKVEFDKKESLGALKTKFYKYNFDEANWFPVKNEAASGEELTPFEVLDFFAKLNLKTKSINPEKAQALYGYYFEKSAEILKKDDSFEYEIWRKSVDSIYTIMESMKNTADRKETSSGDTAPEEIDPREKLFQNFRDLKDAVENKTKDYFDVQEGVSV